MSSLTLVTVLTVALVSITHTETYAQFMKSYNKLSKPEQQWVRRHPIAAFRTHNIADTVRQEAKRRLKDTSLDGDINGGMVDAFKHTLWMALTTQKIGSRKALLLGQAHEEGNRLEYESDPVRKKIHQDSIASRMDMLNNIVGARIGADNPDASYNTIMAIVRRHVLEGKCWKIRKKDKNTYLDADGNKIDIHQYDNNWVIPKVLVKSNE